MKQIKIYKMQETAISCPGHVGDECGAEERERKVACGAPASCCECPGCSGAGWGRAHTGFGVSVSQQDIRTQRAQVGLREGQGRRRKREELHRGSSWGLG